jgi:hypothetical protein
MIWLCEHSERNCPDELTPSGGTKFALNTTLAELENVNPSNSAAFPGLVDSQTRVLAWSAITLGRVLWQEHLRFL